MKFTRLGPAGEIFRRFLTPKWAHLPTSGAGAACDGGRFNRPGIEALYRSRAPQSALEEYRRGASEPRRTQGQVSTGCHAATS
ncbi:RES domain-containing protein [Pararhizobium sp. LjRoot235]|uniref:RES domain-containing protein n=1 Tax=Pararhizobium sp. LjRoot235 TaxID=3342291 RepID=UPI003ECCF5A6